MIKAAEEYSSDGQTTYSLVLAMRGTSPIFRASLTHRMTAV